jgi:hypothetical protein
VSEYKVKTKKKTAQVSLELMKLSKIDRDSFPSNELASKDLFLGDAWFSSIELAVLTRTEHDSNYIGVVKTNHSRYPKCYLEEVMRDWPGGSHINLSATVDGVELVATGYKYCRRKSLNFLWTKGAGHTEAGKPYEANWIDSNGNRSVRFVPRPAVISCYFERSNKIDVSNQMRQSELKLEKVWKTNCGYFRLLTTLIGCNVVDCWRSYRRHCSHQNRHKNVTLLDFISMLAFDMLHNDVKEPNRDLSLNINVMNHTTTSSAQNQLPIPPSMNEPPLPPNLFTTRVTPTTNSPPILGHSMYNEFADFCIRRELLIEEERIKHELITTVQLEKDTSTSTGYRTRRALCIHPECSRRTTKYCRTCDSGRRDRFWVCKHHECWHTLNNCNHTSPQSRQSGHR